MYFGYQIPVFVLKHIGFGNRSTSLDITAWVARGKIWYEYYEKPMATNLVVDSKSAISEETKLSSLAEEVCRRLRNTSLDGDPTRRLEILERLCTKMETSGHTQENHH